MSLELASWITAIATALLAIGAGITAKFAWDALQKQSAGLKALGDQVSDQKDLTAKQAQLLTIQSNQVRLQQLQLDEQRKAAAKEAIVLSLQTDELKESLGQRRREAEERRRAQAAMIFLNQVPAPKPIEFGTKGGNAAAPKDLVTVVNSSGLPIYDAEAHWPAMSAQDNPGSHLFGTIMPDAKPERLVPKGAHASLWFRDAAGVKWVLKLNGHLDGQF